MRQKLIVILAGFSCAGKSTISKLLANRLNLVRMDQYEIYSALAAEHGYQRTRDWLAAIGNKIFLRIVTQETAKRIARLPNNCGAIVDVSYGPEMHRILKAALPDFRQVTFAIHAGRELRAVRMADRMHASTEAAETELVFRDGFLTSVELDQVLQDAEFRVNNEGDLESTVDDIEAILRTIIED